VAAEYEQPYWHRFLAPLVFVVVNPQSRFLFRVRRPSRSSDAAAAAVPAVAAATAQASLRPRRRQQIPWRGPAAAEGLGAGGFRNG
jgi:hypothetical protein